MKILIAGAGKMGSFFCDLLSMHHEVAIYDIDIERLRFTFHCRRFVSLDEIEAFAPDLVLNAVTVKYTIKAFEELLPHLPAKTILSDIASVKTQLPAFYASAGRPFVSTHPMFGPTFASLSNLSNENAVIITEGDERGRKFFREVYGGLNLHIEEYSFEEHDRTTAYSLSVPFAATLMFAGIMKHQDAPGTTFKRHMSIAQGLMSEDDFLISEILFNPNSSEQLGRMQEQLATLRSIIDRRDYEAMKHFLEGAREKIEYRADAEITLRNS